MGSEMDEYIRKVAPRKLDATVAAAAHHERWACKLTVPGSAPSMRVNRVASHYHMHDKKAVTKDVRVNYTVVRAKETTFRRRGDTSFWFGDAVNHVLPKIRQSREETVTS